MARQMYMPKLNEIESDISVAAWLVDVGDTIKEGRSVISVETDKVTVEVEAMVEGKVSRLLVSKGDMVKVGQPILEVE
jgi:pyruvate/2-oxoglutarate dehydrogenase complex dihydrolipoamide acyltransferase (E2) component